jgi:peroxiredoxin family protein
MAAMIASVAAASGDEVSVFFSMNAMQYFVKGSCSRWPRNSAVPRCCRARWRWIC